MAFADIGYGNGFFSTLAAEMVGKQGKVYALGIDPSAIAKLLIKAKKRKLFNMTAKVGAAEKTVNLQQVH